MIPISNDLISNLLSSKTLNANFSNQQNDFLDMLLNVSNSKLETKDGDEVEIELQDGSTQNKGFEIENKSDKELQAEMISLLLAGGVSTTISPEMVNTKVEPAQKENIQIRGDTEGRVNLKGLSPPILGILPIAKDNIIKNQDFILGSSDSVKSFQKEQSLQGESEINDLQGESEINDSKQLNSKVQLGTENGNYINNQSKSDIVQAQSKSDAVQAVSVNSDYTVKSEKPLETKQVNPSINLTKDNIVTGQKTNEVINVWEPEKGSILVENIPKVEQTLVDKAVSGSEESKKSYDTKVGVDTKDKAKSDFVNSNNVSNEKSSDGVLKKDINFNYVGIRQLSIKNIESIITKPEIIDSKYLKKDNEVINKRTINSENISENASGKSIINDQPVLINRPIIQSKFSSDQGETEYKQEITVAPKKEEKKSEMFSDLPSVDNISSKPMTKIESDVKVPILKEKAFEPISNQVINNLVIAVKEDKKELNITLTPENLGKITLKVVSDKDGISAIIITDNSHVKDELLGQSTIVRDILGDQGLKLNNIEVHYKDSISESDMFGGQERQRQQGQNYQQNHKFKYYPQKTDEAVNESFYYKNLEQDAGVNYFA